MEKLLQIRLKGNRGLTGKEQTGQTRVIATFIGVNRGQVTMTQFDFEIALDSHKGLFVLRLY